jgi:hypothetical protein
MKATFRKAGNALHPVGQEALELLQKVKVGDDVFVDLVRPRNLQFHRKFFALLQIAFDHWEPGEKTARWGETAQKNFDRFRKDIIILAGFYYTTVRVDGSLRVEAKSQSFGNMTEDEFEELYSKTIDVILQRIMTNYTKEDLERVVDEIVAFV